MFRSTVCRLKNKNPDITSSFSDTGILFPHYVFSEKTFDFYFVVSLRFRCKSTHIF